MCLGPEALIAAGLTAAGQYVNAREQTSNLKHQQQAKEDALRTELARQEQYQTQAGQDFNKALDPYQGDNQKTNLDNVVAKRQSTIEGNLDNGQSSYTTNTTPAYQTVGDNAPQQVKSDLAKRLSAAFSNAQSRAAALAKLGGTNDLFQNNALTQTQAGNDINTTGNFARNSANVNQYEQRAAYNNAYKAPSGFGDLLSAAGMGLGLWNGISGGTIFPEQMAAPSADFVGPMPVKGPYLINYPSPWG